MDTNQHEFADEVREMLERVIELARSNSIFWVFVDTNNVKRFGDIIRDHQDFFDATAASLLQGFCVITYQLFDKRRDVKSLSVLTNELSTSDASLQIRLKGMIDAQQSLLENFFAYRHKIYAHRDRSQSPWEIFGTVPKPRLKEEMQAIVSLSCELVCALAEAAGIKAKDELVEEIRRREEYAGMDAQRIMEALEVTTRSHLV